MTANNSSLLFSSFEIFKHPAVFGFRTLFYIVLPSETYYENPDDVPAYVEHAVPFFFTLLALEIIFANITGQKSKLPRWNDAFSSLAAGIFSVVPQLVQKHVQFAAYEWFYNHFHITWFELPWNSPITWWLSLLGVDLGYYWFHRMAHEMNILWAAHQVHHSSEDYNLTTALRQSVLQKHMSWIFYLPMAFVIPPSVFFIHLQFNLIFQFWIHTELVDRLGPLEYFLNTPSHHRVHHGRNRYCIDKNYAGVLIIWDRIFGTFAAEDRTDKIVYGLTHPLNSWDILYTQFHHIVHIIRMVYSTPGLSNKLSVIFKGPGWLPGLPRLGREEDIPDIHAPVLKYNKSIGIALSVYIWLHFILTLALNTLAQNNRRDAPYFVIVLASLFIVWTLTNIGYFYENKKCAAVLEILRCVAFLAFDAFYLHGADISPLRLYLGRIIFSLSLVIWLFAAVLPHPADKLKET